jgi:O-antigen/teichoic acid export membrane protein
MIPPPGPGLASRLFRARLLRAASVYTLANSANAAVPLVLIPVLTRFMTPAEYGVLAMYLVLVGISAPLVGLGLQSAILRRFFDQSDEALNRFIAHSVLLVLLATAGVALLLYALAPVTVALTGFPADWFWTVLVSASGQALLQLRLAVLRAENRAVRYGLLQGAHTVATLVLAILLVVLMDGGWSGAVLGYALAAAMAGAVGTVWLAIDGRLQRATWDSAIVRSLLRYGLPLVPHTIAAFSLVATDRLFVANLVGMAETGVYMVGAQLGLGLSMLFVSVNTAYSPWLFERLRGDVQGTREQLVRLTYGAFPLALILAAAVALLAAPFLRIFVGSGFETALPIVRWLALASAFNAMYMMVVNYLFYADRTTLVLAGTGLAAVANVALNFVLVVRFGAVGAAQATTIAFLLKFLFTWWISIRVFPMPWLEAVRPKGANARP